MKKSSESKKLDFPLVAIGASAGGLDAFEHFFRQLSSECNMSFVLITHLDPTHESSLDELISRYTDLKVKVAQDGIQVTPNSIFILPPNRTMSISNGILALKEPSKPHGQRLPIDDFFRSLALDQKENAIGIIFSGTGSDGTLGLREIKGTGGLTIAQTPESAKYDGMPRNAIQNSRVDIIATPEEIADILLKFRGNLGKIQAARRVEETEKTLTDIFHILKVNYGQDFSVYKFNTINRRIERRMMISQIDRLSDYAEYIGRNPDELDLLFRELLIGVTNFFRDKEAFQKLESEIIPLLLKNREKNDTLRVWIPACSTGEEAYSIAMILTEQINKMNKNLKLQIFATDVDALAVEKARLGRYPDNIVADIDHDRLGKFLNQFDNSYEIKKELRDKIIFAVQNVIKDPPFSRVDLISCRNLLIYLTSEIQKKLIQLFHYSLNPDGILFLGTSESLTSKTDMFEVIDGKYKIFKKREVPIYKKDEITIFPPLINRFQTQRFSQESKDEKIGLKELIQNEILNRYSPASVIVDNKNNILYFHGKTDRFFAPPQGLAKMDVISMAKEPIKVELSTSLRKAKLKKTDVRIENIQIKENEDFIRINLLVHPISEPPTMRDLIMVSFEEVEPKTRFKEITDFKNLNELNDARIKYLEEELETNKKHLESTIEELETTNEELKSTNEELQSSNEELQSTNEELQTSKEELQSINEELIAVNTELEEKIEALSKANNDLSNLMKSTKIATVFLNQDLAIKRFTPEFSNIFNVIESDIGRPISHLASNLNYSNFGVKIKEVLQNLGKFEKEVQTIDSKWYQMKISPYLTEEKKVEGVVITFSDITIQKEAIEAVEFYRDLLVHEINNIFQVISTSAEMVKDKTECNDEMNRSFATISNNIFRARKLITNVQKIAEMTGVQPNLEVYNFIPILEEVIKHISEIENKRIETEITFENLTGLDAIFIKADPFLSDLLENIINNGILHNDHSVAEILIKLILMKKDELSYLRIEFEDNGIGIPDQLKEQIFLRLYKKRKKGIGIGLSVVKRIIERYRGEIWVEDKVKGDYKQGSLFIVMLPLSS